MRGNGCPASRQVRIHTMNHLGLEKPDLPSNVRSEYVIGATNLRMTEGILSAVDSWTLRTYLRASSLEYLPQWERELLIARNKSAYGSGMQADPGVCDWLKCKVPVPYQQLPSPWDLNVPKNGPTVEYLRSCLPEGERGDERLETAMREWALRLPSDIVIDDDLGRVDSEIMWHVAAVAGSIIETPSAETPLETADGSLRFLINDFPEEPFWTLEMRSKRVARFDDWPESWVLSPQVRPPASRGRKRK